MLPGLPRFTPGPLIPSPPSARMPTPPAYPVIPSASAKPAASLTRPPRRVWLAYSANTATVAPTSEHVANVEDKSLRPTVTIAAAVCGKCHTTAHHPTFDEWSESPHRHVTEEVAEELEAGTNANSCGECHSGDARFAMKIEGAAPSCRLPQGRTPRGAERPDLVIRHDPHERTGNAAAPAAGMDYQLRYPQITNPEPTNDITTITTNARYGICGQCHRDRGRDWTGTSRGSHHSIQSNVYIGEMPIKTGTALLVPNIRSAHRFVPEQCSTCHMHAEAFVSEEVPANTGHHFEPNTASCSAIGCHPDEADAIAVMDTLQAEVQTRLNNILTRLGDPATWDYPPDAGVGPADQATVPEARPSEGPLLGRTTSTTTAASAFTTPPTSAPC